MAKRTFVSAGRRAVQRMVRLPPRQIHLISGASVDDQRKQRRAEVLRELHEKRVRRVRSAARRVALLRAAADARIPAQARR